MGHGEGKHVMYIKSMGPTWGPILPQGTPQCTLLREASVSWSAVVVAWMFRVDCFLGRASFQSALFSSSAHQSTHICRNTGWARLTDCENDRREVKEWTSVPDVCNYGYVPLSHLGNIVMRMGTTTYAWF